MIILRPEQEEAKRRALEHDGFCLFMEQRTGKTPVSCSIILERDPDLLLVACPKIAVDDTWWKHLRMYGIKADTKVVTLDSVWSMRKQLRRWLEKGKRPFILCDESHRIKDRKSKTSRAMRMLASYCKYKLALTGTPIDSKLEEFWPQFDFVDPSVFGRWAAKADRFGNVIGPPGFKNRFCVMGGFMGRKIIGYTNKKLFYQKLDSRFFRVELEEVKPVPTRVDPDHLVRFDLNESRSAYDSMEQKFMVDLDYAMQKVKRKKVDPKTGEVHYVLEQRVRVVAPLAISLGIKLQQLSGGFVLDAEKRVHRVGFEKLMHCGALIWELNQPTVVFVRYLAELYMTAALCRQLGKSVTLVAGAHAFAGFKTDVCVVQIRSAVSIDLSRAEEVIFNSWNHSHIDFRQAFMRIRSYVSRRARYHYLIANNTVDEDLHRCVTEKFSFAKLVLNRLRRI